jgi:hypothetical protein
MPPRSPHNPVASVHPAMQNAVPVEGVSGGYHIVTDVLPVIRPEQCRAFGLRLCVAIGFSGFHKSRVVREFCAREGSRNS